MSDDTTKLRRYKMIGQGDCEMYSFADKTEGPYDGHYILASDVDALLAAKDAEIAELEADQVQPGMVMYLALAKKVFTRLIAASANVHENESLDIELRAAAIIMERDQLRTELAALQPLAEIGRLAVEWHKALAVSEGEAVEYDTPAFWEAASVANGHEDRLWQTVRAYLAAEAEASEAQPVPNGHQPAEKEGK